MTGIVARKPDDLLLPVTYLSLEIPADAEADERMKPVPTSITVLRDEAVRAALELDRRRPLAG